jgi:hypothetical protein
MGLAGEDGEPPAGQGRRGLGPVAAERQAGPPVISKAGMVMAVSSRPLAGRG